MITPYKSLNVKNTICKALYYIEKIIILLAKTKQDPIFDRTWFEMRTVWPPLAPLYTSST